MSINPEIIRWATPIDNKSQNMLESKLKAAMRKTDSTLKRKGESDSNYKMEDAFPPSFKNSFETFMDFRIGEVIVGLVANEIWNASLPVNNKEEIQHPDYVITTVSRQMKDVEYQGRYSRVAPAYDYKMEFAEQFGLFTVHFDENMIDIKLHNSVLKDLESYINIPMRAAFFVNDLAVMSKKLYGASLIDEVEQNEPLNGNREYSKQSYFQAVEMA